MILNQFMKNFLQSLLMIFILFIIGGELVVAANPSQQNLTLKSGTLIVATYFNNPPFEYLEEDRQVGFEVDLIKEIATRLNLTVEFRNTEWETIIQSLKDNQYDLIMGAITITPEREKIISFSKPYMTTTLSIIINKDRSRHMKHINDLRTSIVGVQAATTDYDIALKMKKMNQIKDVKVYPFNDLVEGINDLVAGKTGAVMKIFPVAFYYIKHYPALEILAPVPNYPQPLGFGINLGNKKLLDAVNKTQAKMRTDGSFNKIYQKWFGS